MVEDSDNDKQVNSDDTEEPTTINAKKSKAVSIETTKEVTINNPSKVSINENERHSRRKIIITLIILAIIIAVGTYLGNKVWKLVQAGNKPIIIPHYLPIKNPHDANETMGLGIVQSTGVYAAQYAAIVTDVKLYPNLDYRNVANKPFPQYSNETFFIVFEGTRCNLDNPDRDFRIGYACVLPLQFSDKYQAYVGHLEPVYISEGLYGLLLGTNDKGKMGFEPTSEKFIAIQPLQVVRDVDLTKLDIYSNVLSIFVAILIGFLVVIWTRR